MYLQGVVTSAGPFNLGALVPMLEPGNPVKTFLGAVSFFTLWAVVVEAVGLGVLYRRRVGPIAGLLVSAYLILTAAFTLGFSLLTGR
jgi:hypothetical protein